MVLHMRKPFLSFFPFFTFFSFSLPPITTFNHEYCIRVKWDSLNDHHLSYIVSHLLIPSSSSCLMGKRQTVTLHISPVLLLLPYCRIFANKQNRSIQIQLPVSTSVQPMRRFLSDKRRLRRFIPPVHCGQSILLIYLPFCSSSPPWSLGSRESLPQPVAEYSVAHHPPGAPTAESFIVLAIPTWDAQASSARRGSITRWLNSIKWSF